MTVRAAVNATGTAHAGVNPPVHAWVPGPAMEREPVTVPGRVTALGRARVMARVVVQAHARGRGAAKGLAHVGKGVPA